MTDEKAQAAISDPQRVRALAHPLRLRILDALGHHGEMTATQCAELTGESVASCSFHLRTLAKYHYIEPGEQRGREKPWRLVSRTHTTEPDFDDPESIQATAALGLTFLAYQAGLMRIWLERDAIRLEPGWASATVQSGSSMWVTVEELREIKDTIMGVADRFAGRWEDPSKRPAGSRPVRMFAMTFTDPDAAAGIDSDDPAEAN
jgi:DNA-binding transcriptional ArsR family regulator